MALWLRRESPLLAHLCVSPQIYRTTLSQSAHCGINRNLSHALRFRCARWNLAIRPWKMTCWSEIWSAIIPPCGVQCKGNECRALPMMSLVPALSCFRPSHRIIHTGLRHVHAHGKKIQWPQNLLPTSTRVWIASRCQFCASTKDGLTLMLST